MGAETKIPAVEPIVVEVLLLPPELEDTIKEIAEKTGNKGALDTVEEFREAAEMLERIRGGLQVAREKLTFPQEAFPGEFVEIPGVARYYIDGVHLQRLNLSGDIGVRGFTDRIFTSARLGQIKKIVTDGKDIYVLYKNFTKVVGRVDSSSNRINQIIWGEKAQYLGIKTKFDGEVFDLIVEDGIVYAKVVRDDETAIEKIKLSNLGTEYR